MPTRGQHRLGLLGSGGLHRVEVVQGGVVGRCLVHRRHPLHALEEALAEGACAVVEIPIVGLGDDQTLRELQPEAVDVSFVGTSLSFDGLKFAEPIKAHEHAAQLSGDFANFLREAGMGAIQTSMEDIDPDKKIELHAEAREHLLGRSGQHHGQQGNHERRQRPRPQLQNVVIALAHRDVPASASSGKVAEEARE